MSSWHMDLCRELSVTETNCRGVGGSSHWSVKATWVCGVLLKALRSEAMCSLLLHLVLGYVMLFDLYQRAPLTVTVPLLLMYCLGTIIDDTNTSTNLHVIQHVLYIYLPYGHGLSWYVHNILLVITTVKGTWVHTYIMTIICYILLLIKQNWKWKRYWCHWRFYGSHDCGFIMPFYK